MTLPMQAYDQPWRQYHDRNHIQDVHNAAFHLSIVQGIDLDQTGLQDAIDLHDVVYVPGRSGCEEASAMVAESYGLTEAARLIRLTENHYPGTPVDEGGILMVNADLFGLASDYGRYRRNTRSIKQEIMEYRFHSGDRMVRSQSEALWKAGRARWLVKFLAREFIFHGPCMEKYEIKARENMEIELTSYS